MDALALQVDTQVCLTILFGLFDCFVDVSQDAALALLAVLEDCINFIAAFGSGQTSHLSAETSLESFVCNTMLQVQVRPFPQTSLIATLVGLASSMSLRGPSAGTVAASPVPFRSFGGENLWKSSRPFEFTVSSPHRVCVGRDGVETLLTGFKTRCLKMDASRALLSCSTWQSCFL